MFSATQMYIIWNNLRRSLQPFLMKLWKYVKQPKGIDYEIKHSSTLTTPTFVQHQQLLL